MPRPSLKDQRAREILDAYLTCVARFGLDGATQDRIAAEAGVKRPLLRHNLGNRDQMVRALCDHVVQQYTDGADMLEAALSLLRTPAQMNEFLFDAEISSDPRLTLAWQALTMALVDRPEMRDPLMASYTRFVDVIDATLTRMTDANPADIRAMAQGITACMTSLDALSPLDPPRSWRTEFKRAAHILTQSLKG